MAGWHHRLNGHEFEKTPGDGEGQGSLVCCSPWGHKESDMTERLNNNKKKISRVEHGKEKVKSKENQNREYLNPCKRTNIY